ncbi:hypothetical protein M9H77_09955 [Catharanthus roseus]|uniref:Uncharacterized protein n=1 Tax=Catharanthus roseus TaxID=4058 RepID=A0ACC0C291_CATRO|nr:hypothetical protein M9H77_09955 [Catharanthus roseus]
MRSAKIKNIFVWFVFSFCFFQVLQGVEVQIYSVENRNSLLNNSKTLSFHCRGEYHWDFDVNFFSTTLLFCHFYWSPKDSVFDVYTWNLGKTYCGTEWLGRNKCIWNVTEHGFSIYKRIGADQAWKMIHQW